MPQTLSSRVNAARRPDRSRDAALTAIVAVNAARTDAIRTRAALTAAAALRAGRLDDTYRLAAAMPRTMLRSALENVDPAQRSRLMAR